MNGMILRGESRGWGSIWLRVLSSGEGEGLGFVDRYFRSGDCFSFLFNNDCEFSFQVILFSDHIYVESLYVSTVGFDSVLAQPLLFNSQSVEVATVLKSLLPCYVFFLVREI
jgi:hypothetical protein